MRVFCIPLARQVKGDSIKFLLHGSKLPYRGAKVSVIDASEATIVNKITDKVTNVWLSFGDDNAAGWKKKIFNTGESLMDRIDYREWALKSIDPATGPEPNVKNDKPLLLSAESLEKDSNNDVLKTPYSLDTAVPKGKVVMFYPENAISFDELMPNLIKFFKEQGPIHKKEMFKSLAWTPLTIPVGLIPVVPNLPAFYLFWRAWSHWKAYRSCNYMLNIMSSHQMSYSPTPELDTIYPPEKAKVQGLLITVDDIPRIEKSLGMDPTESKELERAVKQVQDQVKSEREESTLSVNSKTTPPSNEK